MKLRKCLKHAFEMVVHSKLRSWLTILGIVIGVASVIAIMSIGSGFQQSVSNQLGNLGGDLLTLNAGFSRGARNFGPPDGGGDRGGGGSSSASTKIPILARSDVQALKSLPDIALLETEIRGTVNVSYLGKAGKVSLTGVDPSVWSKITTLKIAQGRMLDSADQNVIVIGGRLASSYFTKPVGINQMISIQGNAVRVVGILDDQSNSIYMPIQMAYVLIPDKTNGEYDSITIKVRDESRLEEIMNATQQRLMIIRHVTPTNMDFSLTSNKLQQQTRAQLIPSINIFLLAIAAVSLIVGAVGIANTMFTSVLEKTKEIGIMKAIGARNKDIMLIFLMNSVLIGLVGGVIGIFFGIVLSASLPALMGGGTGILRGGTLVTMNSVILAMSVSVIIGMLAGVIPAYQASKLRPVDALRYE
jgi:putative ABC transport system permease protein